MTWLRAQTIFPKFSFLFTFLSCVALTLSPFLAVPFLSLKNEVISSWSSILLCWNSVKDSEHLYPSISRKHSGVHSDWSMSVHELIFDLITTDVIKMQYFGWVRIIPPTIFFFCWSIGDLQYWVSFRRTAKSFSYALGCSVRTIACQTPLSMKFSRQEHGAGCHLLLRRIFLIPGIGQL